MPYLQRDYMRPLTRDFADEYRKNEGLNDAENKAVRIREDLDGETFRRALGTIGLGTGKELAELLGVSERQANNYLRDPKKLNTAKESKRYIAKIEESFANAEWAERGDMWELEAYGDAYEDEIEESKRRLSEIEGAEGAVFTNTRYARTLYGEFVARMVLEGFYAMDEVRRFRALDYMRLMLADMQDARANRIADAMKRTACGRGVIRESDLAALIRGPKTAGLIEHKRDIRDYGGGFYKMPYEVIEGETSECVYLGGGIDALVLDEYVGNADR